MTTETEIPKSDGAPAPAPADDLAAKLIAGGFVAHEHLLRQNGTLQCDNTGFRAPWNLRSRLMQFPLEINVGSGGQLHIGLMHPLLDRHPFVIQVAKAIRPHKIAAVLSAVVGAANDAGYKTALGRWWHAIDLIHGHWRALLESRGFTTDENIARAVAYALHHPGDSAFDVAAAREVLAAIGAEPPAPLTGTLKLFDEPYLYHSDHEKQTKDPKKAYFAVSANAGKEESAGVAWGLITGIEAAWFVYGGAKGKKSLRWTEFGRGAWADPANVTGGYGGSAPEPETEAKPARKPRRLALTAGNKMPKTRRAAADDLPPAKTRRAANPEPKPPAPEPKGRRGRAPRPAPATGPFPRTGWPEGVEHHQIEG